LTEEGVRQMHGAVDRGHVVRIVEALAASDGAALVGVVDALRGLGLSAGGTLEEMAALLQQMAVVQAVPDALDPNDPDTPEATRLAALLAADETQLVYSLALHGRGELGLAPDEYSGLVMVLLRMLAFRPKGGAPKAVASSSPSVQGPAAKPVAPRPAPAAASPNPTASAAKPPVAPAVAAAPARVAVAAQPAVVAQAPALRVPASASEPPPWMDALDDEYAAAPSPALAVREPPPPPYVDKPAPAATTFTPTPLGDRWAEIVRSLVEANGITAFARELAMQAQCMALDEQAAPIAVRLRIERETLRAAAPCDKLQAALAESFGRAVRLEVTAGAAEDSTAKRDAAERARRQAQAEQIIHDDPLVQALMSQYKTARIVPGSVKPH
jgi:DNA polymerase-3 subunit gamma/tau